MTLFECPRCDAPLEMGERFCDWCGSRVTPRATLVAVVGVVVAIVIAVALMLARSAHANVVVEDHGEHVHITGTLPEVAGFTGEPRCLDGASCTTNWGDRMVQPMCVVLTAEGLRCVDPAWRLEPAPMPSNSADGVMTFVPATNFDCQQTVRRALEAAQRQVRDPDEAPSYGITTTEHRPPCLATCQLEQRAREIADQKEAARLIGEALECLR